MRYCEVCRASFQALRTCPRDRVQTRADLADPLLGHVVGGRYRILERIAAGGMGQVYLAAHSRIATLFAVKVLYGDVAHDPAMRSRFEREAEVMSCLQSRHIVRVIDFGDSPEELLYLVMEYLDGRPLSTAVAQGGPMPADQAVGIARQIARGLAHAHERGVVHRDLKSANVMLITEDDEPDVARVLDFGIARMQQAAPLTQAGMLMGTPQYMAPEQFAGAETVDARADLYALGIILYEMLAGVPPFEGPSLADLAHQQVFVAPPPIAEKASGAAVPPQLEAVVTKLLAKSRDDRYASARAVVDALQPGRFAGRPSLVPVARDGSVAEAISAAIRMGAPTYNAGDHAGCYAIYRETADALLERGSASLAAAARLEVGLARAASQSSATLAAWEMRYAFDDLLQVTGAATTRGGGAGSVSDELAAAASLVAPRYAMGHLDVVGDYYLVFARRLAHHLRHKGSQPSLCTELERAVDVAIAAGGGQRALASVGGVLEALRQGTSHTAYAAPSSMTGNLPAPAPPPSASLAGIPSGTLVADRIVQAIGVGAPAYNAGDIEGCLRIYRQTAEAIVSELGAKPAASQIVGVLRDALGQAGGMSTDAAAWRLRQAFDTLLSAMRDSGAAGSRPGSATR